VHSVMPPRFRRELLSCASLHREANPAVLLAGLGSGLSAVTAAFSVITVPDGAVTFTVRRTVHVVFGAMLLFSWQTICPVP